jgi:dimethylaniline monooxygenase (N-oxide forming)
MFAEMFMPYRPSDWKGFIPEFLEAEQKRLAGKKLEALQSGESSENASEVLIDIK